MLCIKCIGKNCFQFQLYVIWVEKHQTSALRLWFSRAQITGVSSQEAVLLPEEDLGLPMEMPVLEEREKTPVSVSIPIPSPPPGEEEKKAVEPREERAVREWSPDLEVCYVLRSVFILHRSVWHQAPCVPLSACCSEAWIPYRAEEEEETAVLHWWKHTDLSRGNEGPDWWRRDRDQAIGKSRMIRLLQVSVMLSIKAKWCKSCFSSRHHLSNHRLRRRVPRNYWRTLAWVSWS